MQMLLLDMQLVAATVALMIMLVGYQIYKIRWFRSHGRQVVAVVTSIRHETGKTAQGFSRDNYYLTATWTSPHTGRTYTILDMDDELPASVYEREPGSSVD